MTINGSRSILVGKTELRGGEGASGVAQASSNRISRDFDDVRGRKGSAGSHLSKMPPTGQVDIPKVPRRESALDWNPMHQPPFSGCQLGRVK